MIPNKKTIIVASPFVGLSRLAQAAGLAVAGVILATYVERPLAQPAIASKLATDATTSSSSVSDRQPAQMALNCSMIKVFYRVAKKESIY